MTGQKKFPVGAGFSLRWPQAEACAYGKTFSAGRLSARNADAQVVAGCQVARLKVQGHGGEHEELIVILER